MVILIKDQLNKYKYINIYNDKQKSIQNLSYAKKRCSFICLLERILID